MTVTAPSHPKPACLKSPTDDRWLDAAMGDLPRLLADHAHCEEKAAATALSLVARYPDDVPLVTSMLHLAQEELGHFTRLVQVLRERDWPLGRIEPDRYVKALLALNRVQGVEHVVDHQQTPEWVDIVREISGGGVDVAFDAVGGAAYHQIRRCMAWDGRLLIIGFVGGIAEAPTNHILLKNYSVVGVHWGASLSRNPDALNQQMTSVLDLASSGAVDPLIFPAYSFAEAPRAIQDLAERKTWGKVVVEVSK